MTKIKYPTDIKNLPDIRGFRDITLIDWDGKIASIIFLGGCNFRCGFCHSSSLVLDEENLKPLPFERIERFLKGKKEWVDGVVITGGEPTLHDEKLFNLIYSIKNLGLLIKLDTNGSRPQILKRLIKSSLIDYIAMDIKAPLREEAYQRVTGVLVEIDDIIESKDIILNSGIGHEFRTTVIPNIINIPAIVEIAKSIIPAKRYCLQQFVSREPINPIFLNVKPYLIEELYKMAAVAAEYLSIVTVRRN